MVLKTLTVDLVKDNIDLTFRLSFNLQDSSYIGVKLLDTSFGLYASPDYLAKKGCPASLSDLDSHDCLNMDANRYGDCWNILQDGEITRYRQPWKMVFSNGVAMMDAVRKGMGIGLTPCIFADAKVASGDLVKIDKVAEFPVVGLFAIYPSRKQIPYRLRLFLDFIKEEASQLSTSIEKP